MRSVNLVNRQTRSIPGAAFLAAAALACGAATAAEGDLGGNRYSYERYYAGDISAAKAYLLGVLSHHPAEHGEHDQRHKRHERLTIVDVRDAAEYRSGHPAGAVHMPYPRVFQSCKPNPALPSDGKLRSEDGGSCLYGAVPGSTVSMSDEQLFLSIEARFPDKAERLALLCRTGSRSARAANILAKPEKYLGAGYAGRGYTQVHNIWEGFVGQPLAPIHASSGRVLSTTNDVTTVTLDGGVTAFGFRASALDLNNDGTVSAQDYDGWRYHQALPYVTSMKPQLLNATAFPYYVQP